METATIKSWPEWLHWCSVSIKTEGKWPEKGSRVATYWLNKLPLRYERLLHSEKGWFIVAATWTWIKYKEYMCLHFPHDSYNYLHYRGLSNLKTQTK